MWASLAIVVVAVCFSVKAVWDGPTSRVQTEALCGNDLQCAGEKAQVDAGIKCRGAVERLTTYSVRWVDRTFDPKFSQLRWLNQPTGTLTMIGDRAEFQNGFGAYSPVIYECDFDPRANEVLAVRAREGRLPE